MEASTAPGEQQRIRQRLKGRATSSSARGQDSAARWEGFSSAEMPLLMPLPKAGEFCFALLGPSSLQYNSSLAKCPPAGRPAVAGVYRCTTPASAAVRPPTARLLTARAGQFG